MPLSAPIEFTLYGDDDEVIRTYSRARVPVMFAERAIEISESMENESDIKKLLPTLYQLLVDFYGEKFSVDDLRKGADLGEMISVLTAIATRAGELMPSSPNLPAPRKNPPGRRAPG